MVDTIKNQALLEDVELHWSRLFDNEIKHKLQNKKILRTLINSRAHANKIPLTSLYPVDFCFV